MIENMIGELLKFIFSLLLYIIINYFWIFFIVLCIWLYKSENDEKFRNRKEVKKINNVLDIMFKILNFVFGALGKIDELRASGKERRERQQREADEAAIRRDNEKRDRNIRGW